MKQLLVHLIFLDTCFATYDRSTDIESAFFEVRKCIGEIPILASEQKLLEEASTGEEEDKSKDLIEIETKSGKPRVLADGTYATESALTSTTNARLEAVKAAAKPPLRGECITCGLVTIVLIPLFASFSIDFTRRFLYWRRVSVSVDEAHITIL